MPLLQKFRPKPIKISILYTLAGGGHLSLAAAARDALLKYTRRPLDITLHDPFPSSYSLTHKTLSNQFMDLYRLGYFATNNNTMASAVHYVNYYGIERNLLRFLNSTSPDLIISNHPLITAALPKVVSKLQTHPKTIAHFADPFTIHHTWFINKSADLYLSPTPQITQQAIQHGISAKVVQTTGWLTKEKFLSCPKDKLTTRKALGLDQQKFTLFIGGAGQGYSQIYQLCRQLVQDPLILEKAQVIINTGLNANLITKMIKLVQKYPTFFNLIPFANNIPELLSASDLVIGSAGPNFLFECIHTLRPIIVFGEHSGEQVGNVTFIKSANLGWAEDQLESVAFLVNQLVANPKILDSKLSSLRLIKSQHLRTPQKFTSAVLGLFH